MRDKILGINKRYYPNDSGESEIPTWAVLVAGEIGDYACYVGHSDDANWIARYGNKISFEEAKCHFPSIVREHYRD